MLESPFADLQGLRSLCEVHRSVGIRVHELQEMLRQNIQSHRGCNNYFNNNKKPKMCLKCITNLLKKT